MSYLTVMLCVFMMCSALYIWFVPSSNFSAGACIIIGVRLYFLILFYFLYDFVMMTITVNDGSHHC